MVTCTSMMLEACNLQRLQSEWPNYQRLASPTHLLVCVWPDGARECSAMCPLQAGCNVVRNECCLDKQRATATHRVGKHCFLACAAGDGMQCLHSSHVDWITMSRLCI